MAKNEQRSDRFRLLVYGRMWQRWAFPCILIIPASATVWRFAPQISIIDQRLRLLTLFPALAAVLLLIYTFWARQRSWVECRTGHLRIQTPILPVAISYSRVRVVRPKPFAQVYNAALTNPARRRWLEPYLHTTALSVELTAYPVDEKWLQLWISPYLLDPDSPEIVLVVSDWMTLSRQIDDFRGRWMERRSKQARRRNQRARS